MGLAASLFFSPSDQNCLDYRIRPSDEQYDAQQARWNDLADHILSDVAVRSGCSTRSWLQGSYKFGTQVRPASKGQEFDIDMGVYFQWPGTPDDGPHSPAALKQFVQASLEDYAENETNEAEAEDSPRPRCSRIHFRDSFHIDVPAYHLDPTQDARALATHENAWEDSDPKAIYGWWKDALDEQVRPQCRRMVRYLKMWAALKFADEERPSSIVLTVLAAQAYVEIQRSGLSGEDEVFSALLQKVVERLDKSTAVENPSNPSENLNRLSGEHCEAFIGRLRDLRDSAEKAASAASKTEAAEIWSEQFAHFFPIPFQDELQEEASLKSQDSGRSLASAHFEPIVHVEAVAGGRKFTGVDKIGPIPKGSEITFRMANAHALPAGASIVWTVRNSGQEAEQENDLGHYAGGAITAKRDSAYRGTHYMDVTVRRHGVVIGRKRVPVTITGIGMPLRNPPRPSWTKLR